MTELCRALLDRELEQYDRDYAAASAAGKCKAKQTGSPIFLEAEGSEYAVLLMHGYLSGPAEVGDLAMFLRARGCTVYVPRLPGHGTVPAPAASVLRRGFLYRPGRTRPGRGG